MGRRPVPGHRRKNPHLHARHDGEEHGHLEVGERCWMGHVTYLRPVSHVHSFSRQMGRGLLAALGSKASIHSHPDEVHYREYDDPDDIHEVPIQRGQVHAKGLPVSQDPLGSTASPERVTRDGEQPDDPYCDMGAMKARQDKERSTEQVCLGSETV